MCRAGPPPGAIICSAASLLRVPVEGAPGICFQGAATSVCLKTVGDAASPSTGEKGSGEAAFLSHLSPDVCSKLLAAPLEACTSTGQDSGSRSDCFCFYHDLLMSMHLAAGHQQGASRGGAPETVRRIGSGFELQTVASDIEGFLPSTPEEYRSAVVALGHGRCSLNSILGEGSDTGEQSVVEATVCSGKLTAGKRSFVRGCPPLDLLVLLQFDGMCLSAHRETETCNMLYTDDVS